MKWFNCAVVIAFIAASNAQDPISMWPLAEGPVQTAKDFGSNAWNMTENALQGQGTDYRLLWSPSEIFNVGINLVLGLPVKFLMGAVNQFCAAAINSNVIKSKNTPDMSKMNFLYMTKRNRYNVSLTSAGDLVKIPEFIQDGTLVVFITGWTSDLNKERDDVTTMYDAFKCRPDVNFVVVDSGRFIDTLYSWSALNTEAIGQDVGVALASLYNENNVRKIHVIGHSLGAQISGAVGRSFHQKTNQLIPHITGLDPARPCFNEGESLTGLFRGDAEFVDIIHTNPGIFGQREPLGDVDFFPNGVNPIPPTCVEAACAHFMAWRLYAEASYPGNEMAFMGTKCSSLDALNTDRCKNSPKSSMGPLVDMSAKGNYFLRTNRRSPYGLDSDRRKMTC